MSYNIRFGGVGREQRIADVINDASPDIVVLQEATHPGVVERLSELTRLAYYASKHRHSTAFMSRVEPTGYRWHHDRSLQRAVLEIDISGMRIFNVHLRATHSNLTERGRMRELRAILKFVEEYKDEFHVVVGDLNTLAPGELLNMQKLPTRYKVLAFLLGGKISFRAIKIMLDAGYADVYRKFNSDPGYTFPAWDPHVRLDYLLTPEKFLDRVENCSVMTGIDEPAKATDHLPLIVELTAA